MQKILLLISLAFSLNAFSQIPNYIPTSGLVGYWPFTGNANDASVNGHNGTAINGTTLIADRNGVPNAAYSFDGVNDYIDVPYSSALINLPTLSLSVWVNLNNITPTLRRILHQWGPLGVFTLRVDNGNGNTISINVDCVTTGGYAEYALSGSDVNGWTNIIVTYDNVNLKLYRNGVLMQSTPTTGSTCALSATQNDLIFGGNSIGDPTSAFFLGKMDDIGIWNRALTTQEITTLYNGVSCSTTITPQTATTFCTGGSVTLNASAGSSYTWSNTQTGQNITVSQGGTYTVTVTDANACTASASVSVTVNALPTATPTASPSTICNGNNTTLAANATAGSGSISTYAWSSGIGGNSTGGSVSPTGNATYTVTVTNSNNCSASASTSVTVNAKPTVAPSAAPSAFCVGFSTTLAANAAAGSGTISSYAWSSGIAGNLSGGSVSPTGNATYNVTVTNSNNCTVTSSVSVTVYPLPTVTFTLPAFISNNASTLTLDGSPAGGSYVGVGGLSGNTLNPSQAGLGSKFITYTNTNGNGCTNSANASTVVYDTTGVICTHYDTSTTHITVYDTTHVTVNDTTHVSVSTTDTLIIDVTLTGVNPPNNSNAVIVYPNPAHDHLIVNNGNLSLMTGYSIKITNLLGQIVFNQPVNQQQFYIDLSTWGGNGTYILYVLDAQQTVKSTKEIVLQ